MWQSGYKISLHSKGALLSHEYTVTSLTRLWITTIKVAHQKPHCCIFQEKTTMIFTNTANYWALWQIAIFDCMRFSVWKRFLFGLRAKIILTGSRHHEATVISAKKHLIIYQSSKRKIFRWKFSQPTHLLGIKVSTRFFFDTFLIVTKTLWGPLLWSPMEVANDTPSAEKEIRDA